MITFRLDPHRLREKRHRQSSTALFAPGQRGSALVIVLTFVALLSVLVFAFLTRSVLQQKISQSSANRSKVELLADGAVDNIIGDFKQEIAAGNSATNYAGNSATNYYPSAGNPQYTVYTPYATNMVPYPVTTSASINSTTAPNLIKMSAAGQPFYWADTTNGGKGRAAGTAGSATAGYANTTMPSLNGRAIALSRWNKALLLPTTTPASTTDFTPAASTGFTASNAPNWVLIARDGSNPTAWNVNVQNTPANANANTVVVGRYAYTVYDEGGLLDMNVAGCPVSAGTAQPIGTNAAPYKNALAYADLTQIPGISALAPGDQASVINAIVGWRNNASAQATGTFPSYTFPSPTAATPLTPFDQTIFGNLTGFLRNGSTALNGTQSDQAFTSRQQLINLLKSLGPTSDGGSNAIKNFTATQQQAALTAMGTFSRDINQPSYAPASGRPSILAITAGGNDKGGAIEDNTTLASTFSAKTLNPSFLTVRVTAKTTRNDGTTAALNEPLVKSRFVLNRLAWLTYQGVSANRNYENPSSVTTGTDYDIYLLENNYGISSNWLEQGTAANVYKYFGLSWVKDTRKDINGVSFDSTGKAYVWVYNHSNSNAAGPFVSLPAAGTGTPILTLGQVAAAGREPDFVELLKAAISAGSLAKTAIATGGAVNTPSGYQSGMDSSLDAAIIQIAANIIDQFDTDSVPTSILFDDGTWAVSGSPIYMEYRGVEDLPYFYRVRGAFLPIRDSNPSTVSTQAGNHDGSQYTITTPTIPDQGLGAAFQIPEIWNPHAYNTSATVPVGPRPTEFRIVAQDAPPYQQGPVATDPNQITMWAHARYNAGVGSVGEQVCSPTTNTTQYQPEHAMSLTPINTELDFEIPINRLDLFREPTLLMKPGIPVGSNLTLGSQNAIYTDATTDNSGKSINNYISPSLGVSNIGNPIKGIQVQNPLLQNIAYTNNGLTDNLEYLGIYLGDYPLRWTLQTAQTPSPTYAVITTNIAVAKGGNQYITYRLQAQDPNTGAWITYDEKYTNLAFEGETNTGTTSGPLTTNNILGDGLIYSVCDPRTSRFGIISDGATYTSPASWNTPIITRFPMGGGGYTKSNQAGWAATTGVYSPAPYKFAAEQNATWSNRPDLSSGFRFNSFPSALGFYQANAGDAYRLGGMFQNNPAASNSNNRFNNGLPGSGTMETGYSGGEPGFSGPQYFADADGVIRRGMGAFLQPTATLSAIVQPSGAPTGNPQSLAFTFSATSATPITTEIPSRPIVLNRPFRSVAELGYVFSGTPWRNLDFFTPESGTSSLLDIFSIDGTDNTNELVSGKINLNMASAPVLQAILSNAYFDEYSSSTGLSSTPGTVSAQSIATAMRSRFNGVGIGYGNVINLSQFIGFWNSSVAGPSGGIDGGQSYIGFGGMKATSGGPSNTYPNLSYLLSQDNSASGYTNANIQRFREGIIRALSNTSQTRTWNLMIDVIVQSGQYPINAGNLDQFNVDGEKRFWVHLAIDRFTGQVLDKEIEVVKE